MPVFDVGQIYLVSSLCSFVFSSVDGFLLSLEHVSVNKSVKIHWSNFDSPQEIHLMLCMCLLLKKFLQ